ncbi:hypothetical protein J7E67_23475 [Bacillus sp. ISL-46]|nr:hypothetical protein [Bacillus sp. ISL-46]
MRTIKKAAAMDAKLCSEVQDFLYLINFVFFSSQDSTSVDGSVNKRHLNKIPYMPEFLVT